MNKSFSVASQNLSMNMLAKLEYVRLFSFGVINFLSSNGVGKSLVFPLYKLAESQKNNDYSIFRKIHIVTLKNIQTLENKKISIKF